MTEVLDEAVSILGFDPFDPAFRADPYPTYDRLRAAGPLWRTPGQLLLATSHRVCSQIFKDSRFGHHTDAPSPVPFRRGPQTGGARWFVVLDPPDHTRLRRLVTKAFTPRLIAGLRPRIAELAETLLDEAVAAREVDLIGVWAYPLSLTVITEMLGVPVADRELMKRWSATIARAIDPDFVQTGAEKAEQGRTFVAIKDYFAALVAERRTRPTDDLLGQLVKIEEQGDRLTLDELVATCILLLFAGHETVVDLLGNATVALSSRPEQARWLAAHPEAAPTAVDELLRFDPPVQALMRTALVDCELEGVPVRRGDMVMLLMAAANRDPAAFPEPDRLDLRRDGERHLSFGAGIHYCVGAALGRLEGSVALTTLLRRAPDLALTGEPLRHRDNLMARGLTRLPVRLR
ncbi:cytochrome P450 [Asanoa sp. WMMD1127]|uniref:cytochrome P450 n=1 Tax=Asanoa sp. WMMD1127 TaxID=3016107 RepID=UPI00241780F4|nr:cytochrome P450 [Asanoa sp. WMMD1127]MDG4820745.1 cytochrome P450 [Asanoa sp. WMMD1127]